MLKQATEIGSKDKVGIILARYVFKSSKHTTPCSAAKPLSSLLLNSTLYEREQVMTPSRDPSLS
jgi:hypothetical protein